MKAKTILWAMVLLLSASTGSVYGEYQGYSNTFYGVDAGMNTTVPDGGDTFIGAHSGQLNILGLHNTFVGYYAGNFNSTGMRNTFIGYYAGLDNNGRFNTFIGCNAGGGNTDGEGNTFVGDQSGSSNTDGYSNTFVGQSAGLSNETGVSNTFVGFKTGLNGILGSGNTFVGREAGRECGGNRNTMIGEYAGSINNGWYNVFIGWNAGAYEAGSNKLYIANSDTLTPLIYGDFNSKLLVIHGVLSVASSREYKENIDQLKPEKAIEILQHLNPVEFSYKATPAGRHLGFISEEVPESLTTKERKAVSPMDIVAVLTKVVQEQQKTMQEQRDAISTLSKELKELRCGLGK